MVFKFNEIGVWPLWPLFSIKNPSENRGQRGQTPIYLEYMQLTVFDWIVIAGYFLFNLGIGVYYSRRARGSTNEFFLSGRDVPWWLAGTSMVATTFAADTPLAVTGFVARN